MFMCRYNWEKECDGDGKNCIDCILNKINAEIDNIDLNEVARKYEDSFYGFQQEVIKIINNYKGIKRGK